MHPVHPAWPQHRLTRTGLPPTGTGGGGVYALGLSPRLAQLRRGGRAHHYQAQPRAGRRGRAHGADHAHVPGGHVRESTHVALAGRDGRARVAEEDDDARRYPGADSVAKGRVAARCRRRLWRGNRLEDGLAAPRRTRSRVLNQRLAGTCALVAPATALLGVALAPGAQARLPALCAREGAAGTGCELQGSEDSAQQARLPHTCPD